MCSRTSRSTSEAGVLQRVKTTLPTEKKPSVAWQEATHVDPAAQRQIDGASVDVEYETQVATARESRSANREPRGGAPQLQRLCAGR